MKRILVAVDDSATASLVLRRAAELASATGAKLRLFHAIPQPDDVHVVRDLVRDALRGLSLLERSLPVELRDGIDVGLGRPWEQICAEARNCEADLVVIGAHDYRIAERLAGTTAARVVDHIDRPLLIVRSGPGEQRAWTTPSADGPLGVHLARRLRAEHVEIDRACDEILAAYRAGDWSEVLTQWGLFEPLLRRHMQLEEEDIFPTFRAAAPAEADALAADHDALRHSLDVLAVHLELHAVPEADMIELVRRVHAHGAHEEALLYTWLSGASSESLAPAA